MAFRKLTINLNVKLVLEIGEGEKVSDVISEMDYDFTPIEEQGFLVDSEIIDYEIVDSK